MLKKSRKSIEPLSPKEESEIQELIAIVDDSLKTEVVVLTADSASSKLVGSVVGGDMGAILEDRGVFDLPKEVTRSQTGSFITAKTPTVSAIEDAAVGSTLIAGASIAAGMVSPPVAILAALGAVVGKIFTSKNKSTRIKDIKEEKKQANYCKELCEKMNALLEKHNREMERFKAMHKQDQKTIRAMAKDSAEKDLEIEALLQKITELEVLHQAMDSKRVALISNFE